MQPRIVLESVVSQRLCQVTNKPLMKEESEIRVEEGGTSKRLGKTARLYFHV